MSKIISVPSELKATDIKYLQKLCSLYPKEPDKPNRYNNYSPRDFNLEEWMDKHGLHYRRSGYAGGTKYILDCCPFDSNHKKKDACIFRSSSGAIGFHCFHNSCADKTWKDVRILFEPDAYEKRWQEDDRRMYKSYNRDRKPELKKIVEQDGKPVFYTAMDVFNLPQIRETFIRTGIETLDSRTRGLQKSRISLVSGLRGSAKSTLLSQWILDAVDAGNNVGCFSGELTERNFMRWMNQQAAGKAYVEPSKYPGYYNVPKQHMKSIAEWLGGHFWLYNNEYGNNFSAVMEKFESLVEEKKLDMLVLDNLMAFDIGSLSEQKFEAQTKFVLRLADLAKRKNIHILFVAHPRKAMGFLRLDDISGSADLANAVDYAFIVHRNNNDFQRLSNAMFGWKADNEVYSGTNVIEVAKDRDGGTQDLFIPLWYEAESKRLKNSLTENKLYGWCKGMNSLADDGFEEINTETPWDSEDL
jgi:archaellum biogenesis ATPase FlaH